MSRQSILTLCNETRVPSRWDVSHQGAPQTWRHIGQTLPTSHMCRQCRTDHGPTPRPSLASLHTTCNFTINVYGIISDVSPSTSSLSACCGGQLWHQQCIPNDHNWPKFKHQIVLGDGIISAQPGFDLPHHTWSLLNYLGQRLHLANLHRWGLAKSTVCKCGHSRPWTTQLIRAR